MNKKERDQLEEIQLDYKKAKGFVHCKNCTEQFLHSPLHEIMTPREYGMYEVSTYPFVYPDKKVRDIIVLWCKRCGNKVWDSRKLS